MKSFELILFQINDMSALKDIMNALLNDVKLWERLMLTGDSKIIVEFINHALMPWI